MGVPHFLGLERAGAAESKEYCSGQHSWAPLSGVQQLHVHGRDEWKYGASA